MAPYQTFPGEAGNSDSIGKLRLLRLPELAGKYFLDVGCNEGFFCGFAQYENAARVVGLDRCNTSIENARKRFPGCEFVVQRWEELPAGPFDVILIASSLHYAKDQERLIHDSMGRLAPDGILVLELGIGPKGRGEWVEVKSGAVKRCFPTWAKLEEILEPYAWKNFGPSLCKKGHPERYIVHVRRRRPMAYLLTQLADDVEGYICSHLFKTAEVQVLTDQPSLNASLMDSLVKLYFQQGKQHDVVVAGSVVTKCQATTLSDYVIRRGYLPIEVKSPVKSLGSRNLRPAGYSGRRLAYLLMQPPAYGKTTISRRLFKRAGITVVSGDATISAVAKGCLVASDELTEAIRLKFTPLTINQATHHILNTGLIEGLVKLYVDQAKEPNLVLDAYVPAEYHQKFAELIAAQGYTPITLTWNPVGPALSSAQKMLERADAYFSRLAPLAKNNNTIPQRSGLPFKGTKGCVEHLTWEHGDKLTIRGWAVHETGEMPSVFRVLWRDREVSVLSMTRQARADVQRHFKLEQASYGFILTARASRESDISEWRRRLKVFAGVRPDELHGPFHFHHERKMAATTNAQ